MALRSFENYYDEEMRYLREAGKEFAEAFPERARFLNLDAVEDRDPYVERLFEGFAFLSARIRHKLDDDFPEFSRSLMEMVAPDFLEPIPSCAMLEFYQTSNPLQEPYVVERGMPVLSELSGPVGQRTVCRFQTTKKVTLYPLSLSEVERIHDSTLGEGLKLNFSIASTAQLDKIKFIELPLYFHGEKKLGSYLHYIFTQNLNKVFFEYGDAQYLLGGQEFIKMGGFLEEESLLPPIENAFKGSRLLLEYFAYEEKFRFADLKPIPIPYLEPETQFSLNFYFKDSINDSHRIKKENFRIYATF